MMKNHTNIEAVTIFEEDCESKDSFTLAKEVHYGCEAELMSRMVRDYAVDQFDMEYVLGLNDYPLSEAKIVGRFMYYAKLVVENHCYNGIKI